MIAPRVPGSRISARPWQGFPPPLEGHFCTAHGKLHADFLTFWKMPAAGHRSSDAAIVRPGRPAARSFGGEVTAALRPMSDGVENERQEGEDERTWRSQKPDHDRVPKERPASFRRRASV